MIPFSLNNQDIHALNVFQDQQMFTISIGNNNFLYSLEQLAFFSPHAFSHYLETEQTFQIEDKEIQQQQYLDCFKELDDLLRNSSNLQINSKNVQFFLKIAEVLGNLFLFDACESFFEQNHQEFSFSSHHLIQIGSKARKSLKNFTFVINNQSIQINKSLFSCVSDLFLNIDSSSESLSFNVSDNVFKCFSSFIKIFDGITFYWMKFDISTLLSMIKTFHLHSLQIFLNIFK
jgi:hypothetical protein